MTDGARGPRAAPGPRSALDLLGRILPPALLLAYGLAFAWTALGARAPRLRRSPRPALPPLARRHARPGAVALEPGLVGRLRRAPVLSAGLRLPGRAAPSRVRSARSLSRGGVSGAPLVVFLLPGLSTYVLLARALGSGWLALPGALLALTISAETRSGVEEGLRWGLVAARLGWGLLPLLALALIRWIEGRSRSPLVPAVVLAAIVLAHPAHAPLAAAMVLLALAVAPGPPESRAVHAGLVLGLGAGLDRVLAHPPGRRFDMTLPLAWGDASLSGLARRLADYPLLAVLAAATAAAWGGHARRADADRGIGWLLALAPAAVGLVAADALLGELGARWLPADRVADGLVLALVLGASVGLAALARLVPRCRRGGSRSARSPAWSRCFPPGATSRRCRSGRSAASGRPTRRWSRARASMTSGRRCDGRRPAGSSFVRSSVPARVPAGSGGGRIHTSPRWPRSAPDARSSTARSPIRRPWPASSTGLAGGAHHPARRAAGRRAPCSAGARALLRRRSSIDWPSAFRMSAVVALDEDADRLGFLDPGAALRRGPSRRTLRVLCLEAAAPIPVWLEPDRVRVEAMGTRTVDRHRHRLLAALAGACRSRRPLHSPRGHRPPRGGAAAARRRGCGAPLRPESPRMGRPRRERRFRPAARRRRLRCARV